MTRVFGLDRRSLAVFRIILGLTLVWDLLSRLWSSRDFLWGSGLAPAGVATAHLPLSFIPSIHLLSPSLWYQVGLLLIGLGLSVALTLGYRTRAITPLTWYLLLSLHLSNELVLNGGDYLTRNLLLVACFLPWGQRWSLDNRAYPDESDESPVVNVATVALFFQVCFLYWTSAMLKTDPTWSRDGTAIFYALSLDNFATPFGQSLLRFPFLLKVLTLTTYALEWVGPLLVLMPSAPIRVLGIASMIGLHLGIGLSLTVGLFWIVPIAMLCAFLPKAVWTQNREPYPAKDEDLGDKIRLSTLSSVFLGLVTILLLYLNLSTQLSRGLPVPNALFYPMRFLGLHYGWGMFTGLQNQKDGVYLVVAELKDGSQRELLWGHSLPWHKPDRVSALFPDHRWQRYLLNLNDERFAVHRKVLLEFVAQRHERQEPKAKLQKLSLLFMYEPTYLNYRDTEPERQVLESSLSW